MIKFNNLIAIVICLLIPFIGFSAQYTSVQNGTWDDPATWGASDSSIPGTGDDVTIDGHEVSILYANVTIGNLEIINSASSSSAKSELIVNGNITLTITGNLMATAYDIAQEVNIYIRSTSIVNVAGNLIMERTSTNTKNEVLSLVIYESGKLNVTGNFEYNYRNSGSEDINTKIKVYGSAIFTVDGESTINQLGGRYFNIVIYSNGQIIFNGSLTINASSGSSNFEVNGSSANLAINKDLTINNSAPLSNDSRITLSNGGNASVSGKTRLNSTASGAGAFLYLTHDNSTFDQNGDLILHAVHTNDTGISMTGASNFYLAGNIDRTSSNGYGDISMGSTSKFYFDGTSQQTIPTSQMSNAGTDAFNFTNTIFANTSPDGLIFEGNVVSSGHMILNDGIIHTSETAMLVLDNGASIDAGNSTSYVDGPMIKRGSTGGDEFTFPVGGNGVYAPITIDPISNSTLEYTVEYIGCPPPTLNLVNAPLQHVNNTGYWAIERSDNASVGNISLHWTDADIVGITDTNSLVVSYYLPATGWHSLGKETIKGDIGSGVSGSVKNDIGCPPPTLATRFGIGSIDASKNTSPLPVEFINFTAYKNQNNSKVFLEWTTASEENSAHFIIEKSTDGSVFHEIERVQSVQNSNTIQFYGGIDKRPNIGNNYYRIQQVDQDDIMSFTKLINVFINEQDEAPTVYPNPVQDQLNVYNKALSKQEVFVKIVDLTGHCIYSNYHQNFNGQIHLSVPSLNIKKPGVYFIHYQEEGGRHYSQQFMKMK